MRTIKNLTKEDGRVYVYLASEEIGDDFFAKAESEGFTFGDGTKPTEKHYSEIIAINHDCTLNYVGANGYIAFGSGAKTIGEEKLIRVDYEKYISGDKYYLYSGKK